MANKRIPFEPDKMYHVYNHAIGSECLFRSEENYHYFLKKYAQYIYPVVETFAYCLMPNHFHFLIRIRPAEELLKLAKNPVGFENLPGLVSRQFSHFLNAYAKAFNAMYDRKGSLFMGDINRKLVPEESYYTKLIHYIHYNPVHHGFVEQLAVWPHSSFHSLFSIKPTLLQRQVVLDWFGSQDAYLVFHQQPPDNSIEAG
jgi:putative transposase